MLVGIYWSNASFLYVVSPGGSVPEGRRSVYDARYEWVCCTFIRLTSRVFQKIHDIIALMTFILIALGMRAGGQRSREQTKEGRGGTR